MNEALFHYINYISPQVAKRGNNYMRLTCPVRMRNIINWFNCIVIASLFFKVLSFSVWLWHCCWLTDSLRCWITCLLDYLWQHQFVAGELFLPEEFFSAFYLSAILLRSGGYSFSVDRKWWFIDISVVIVYHIVTQYTIFFTLLFCLSLFSFYQIRAVFWSVLLLLILQ